MTTPQQQQKQQRRRRQQWLNFAPRMTINQGRFCPGPPPPCPAPPNRLFPSYSFYRRARASCPETAAESEPSCAATTVIELSRATAAVAATPPYPPRPVPKQAKGSTLCGGRGGVPSPQVRENIRGTLDHPFYEIDTDLRGVVVFRERAGRRSIAWS